jgi:hypothetical protein
MSNGRIIDCDIALNVPCGKQFGDASLMRYIEPKGMH